MLVKGYNLYEILFFYFFSIFINNSEIIYKNMLCLHIVIS